MGDLITPNQSAFVGGRLIQDNLIIAHEVFHSLKRRDSRGRSNVAIKLDMSKAYDRLEWIFIKNCLLAYGFHIDWVNMVMKLITSVSYQYKVNGFASSTLIPQRGLRQGDPLSPYIFILAADALSHMINKALDQNRIQGVQLAQGGPKLTHLFFADDALLFGKATHENMYQLVEILNIYSRASGQRINLGKSGLIVGKFMDPRLKVQLATILRMQLWDNPGKYLGLLAEWGSSKVTALNWIKQRIEAKMEGWKECLLNQAGKEVLIKAVLQAIPTFAMSMVRFPKNFCSKICASIARFWWRSKGRTRGIHWKNWEALTNSKMEGGLRFKDFTHMNSSLLAKQAWRIIQNPNALWVQVLKCLYFPNSDFVRATRKRNNSWVWASLIHGKEVLMQNARWVVGNGNTIDILNDCWVASGKRLTSGANSELRGVSDIMDSERKIWDVNLIRQNFPPADAIQIVQTPIAWHNGDDSLWWPFTKSGEYTTKTGYFQAYKQQHRINLAPSTSLGISYTIWKDIWKVGVPQKIKHFLWKVCHNALPVGENLWKKKVANSPICPLCGVENETIEHMLLLCEWTRGVWFGLQIQCTPRRQCITSIHDWLGNLFKVFEELQEFNEFAKISICCALWSIWKGRNQAYFDSKNPSPIEVLNKTVLLQQDYYSHWLSQSRRSESQVQSSQFSKNWRPPTKGVTKINTDARFVKGKNKAWAGIILRNEKGEILTGLTKVMHASSPLMAEALSFREAMSFAESMGLERITVENDCLELIQACRDEISRGEISNIVKDIKVLKTRFQMVAFTRIYREGNKAAHTVAHLAANGSLTSNWVWNPPRVLWEVLQSEKGSTSSAGFPFDPGLSTTMA